MNKQQILEELNSSNGYYVCLRNMFKNPEYMDILSKITETKNSQSKFKYDSLCYTKWRGDKEYQIGFGYLVSQELRELMKKDKLIKFSISCIFDTQKYKDKKGELVKLLENDERFYQCKRAIRVPRQKRVLKQEKMQEEQQKVKTQPLQKVRSMKINKQQKPPKKDLNKNCEPKPTKLKIVEQKPVKIPVIKKAQSSDQEYFSRKDDYKKQNSTKGNISQKKTLATTKILSSDSDSDEQLNNLMKTKAQKQKLNLAITKSVPTANQSYMKPKAQTQSTMFSFFGKKPNQ